MLLIHWLLLLLSGPRLLLWCHVTHHARPLGVHGWSPTAPLLVCWLKLPTPGLLDLLELLLNLRGQLGLRAALLHPEHSLLLWV